jgi:hypothetical protein
MANFNREERLNILLTLATQRPVSADIFKKLYLIILKYDLPKHADRDFVFESLIQYFASIEDYIKCSKLVNCKKDLHRHRYLKNSFENVSTEELEFLKSLGYIIPDSITKQVLIKN